MRARRPWLSWSAITAIVAVAFVLAVNWRNVAAEPEPEAPATEQTADGAVPAEEPADEQAEEKEPALDELLEVEFRMPLRAKRGEEHEYLVDVRVKNVSDEPVQGPVYLAITGTDLEGLEVVASEGIGRRGDPLFEVVEEDRALSHRSRRGRELTLTFRTEEELTDEQREEAAIDHELTREGVLLESPEDAAVAEGRTRGAKNRRLPIPHGDEALARARANKKKHAADILKIPGVVGMGTMVDEQGSFAYLVLIRRLGVKRRLPPDIEGIPVKTEVTWGVRPLYQPDRETIFPPPNNRAQAGSPQRSHPQGHCFEQLTCDGNADLQSRYDPLIPIGAQIRNENVAGVGTNGGLVTDGSQFFYLSNAHVLVRTGDDNAQIGEVVTQPGTGDAANDVVGTLARFAPRDFRPLAQGGENEADVAVALVDTAIRKGTHITPCSGYGGVSQGTVPAEIGMIVEKVGRTTAYTQAEVLMIDFDVDVAGTGFVNTIAVRDEANGGAFAGPGDSGSLVVTQTMPCRGGSGTCRYATGLLFAGETAEANPIVFLNPIDAALQAVGNLSIVGQPEGCPVDPLTP